MNELITKIFKETEQFKKIVFIKPICIDPILFDFNNNQIKDSNVNEELNKTIIGLLNDYKKMVIEKQYNIDNMWNYITLLHKCRKIFLNNSHIFQYTSSSSSLGKDKDKDDDYDDEEKGPIISSSSLDFELSMILYIVASKEQSLVDDNINDNDGAKKNAIHLLNAKICLEEAYNIAKECNDNLDNIVNNNKEDNDDMSPYNMLLNKKIISDIKTPSISSEDSNKYLIKSNLSSCSEWINDIGGLDLMKSRHQIAYCQSNENFYKAIKSSKSSDQCQLNKMNISYSISQLYKEIISVTLVNEKYNDNNLKRFSKFMYYYWNFKAHKILFKTSCNEYFNCEDEIFMNHYETNIEIPSELNRYSLLCKYYNKMNKIIKDNKNMTSFDSIIIKKKSSIDNVYNNLCNKLDKWNLSKTTEYKECNLKFDSLYCTSLANKITFTSSIEKSLNKIQKIHSIKRFIDFCDNKSTISTSESIVDIDYNELKDKFKKQCKKWEKEHSTLKNNDIFILGKIDSDITWMIFFMSLFENDKTISDNQSFGILKTSIKKFINTDF